MSGGKGIIAEVKRKKSADFVEEGHEKGKPAKGAKRREKVASCPLSSERSGRQLRKSSNNPKKYLIRLESFSNINLTTGKRGRKRGLSSLSRPRES